MNRIKAYSAASATSPLASDTIPRREPADCDVQIEILYCGICHSDVHYARNEWSDLAQTVYPAVPGHEIVGRVTKVGAAVTRFQAGDLAAVGCIVDADLSCPHCRAGHENFSPTQVWTYGGYDKYLDLPTYGGYSERIVVHEHFVLKVPANLNLAATAPLLCAGITTYSPLRHWEIGPGKKVGIVGLGGLGHMGVKFARAFGAHVVVFTTSPSKVEDALRLGAHEVVISKHPDEMKRHTGSFDFILNAVAAKHDLAALLNLLKVDGTMTLLGAPEKPHEISAFPLILGRRRLAGSIIGSIPETQEMLDFCGVHGITSDIELIPIQKINEAYDRIVKGDVKYRFVIDMASLRAEA
ncbi:MAG TPA: NAD(P)-dependent alcohol dehydrogenase [Luteolibacter sp.]|nr:NAD(P)-dependent alcohol dehydrogenase [Luteolibacter sp.]